MGQGTFGQVVECTRLGPDGGMEQVAVKVIKNQSAYFQQVHLLRRHQRWALLLQGGAPELYRLRHGLRRH